MADAADLRKIVGDAPPLDDDHPKRLGREVVGLARTEPIDAPWLDIDRYGDVEIDGQLLRFWALPSRRR